MWSIIISTVVYLVASWAAGAYLGNELGWERGRSRAMVAGLVGLVVSSLVAWGIDAAFPSQAVTMGSLSGLAGGAHTQVAPGAAAGASALSSDDARQVQAQFDAIMAGQGQSPAPAPRP